METEKLKPDDELHTMRVALLDLSNQVQALKDAVSAIQKILADRPLRNRHKTQLHEV